MQIFYVEQWLLAPRALMVIFANTDEYSHVVPHSFFLFMSSNYIWPFWFHLSTLLVTRGLTPLNKRCSIVGLFFLITMNIVMCYNTCFILVFVYWLYLNISFESSASLTVLLDYRGILVGFELVLVGNIAVLVAHVQVLQGLRLVKMGWSRVLCGL